MDGHPLWFWDLRSTDGGMLGLEFARAMTDPQPVMWVHAAPSSLRVSVRDRDGALIAHADALVRDGDRTPMTRLVVAGGGVTREDRWPQDGDLGAVVLVAAGEVGVLLHWEHAPDHSSWRWRVEYSNTVGEHPHH